MDQGYAKCEEFIQQAKEGKLKPQPGLTIEQTLEGLITRELSSLRDQAGTALSFHAHILSLFLSFSLSLSLSLSLSKSSDTPTFD
jgi:hypothetical protein